jgi:hypothetical protein
VSNDVIRAAAAEEPERAVCGSQAEQGSAAGAQASSTGCLGPPGRTECDLFGLRDGLAASGRLVPRPEGLVCPSTPINQQAIGSPATGSWQRRFHDQGWAPTLQIPPNHGWTEAVADIPGDPLYSPLSVSQTGPLASGGHPSTPVLLSPHLLATPLNTLSPRALQLDDYDLDIMDGVAEVPASDVVPRACHAGSREHDLRRAAIFNQTSSRLSPRPPSRLSQSRPGRIFISDEQPYAPTTQPSSPLGTTLHVPGHAGAVLQSSPLPPPASSVRGPAFLPQSPASPLASSSAAEGHTQLPLPLFNNRHVHSTPASPAGVMSNSNGVPSGTLRYGLHGASPLSPQRGLQPLPVTPTATQRPRSQAALRDSTDHGTPPQRRLPAEWMNQNIMMLMPNRLREVADIAASTDGWRSPVVSSTSSSNSSPRVPLEPGLPVEGIMRRENVLNLPGNPPVDTAIMSNPAARAAAVLSARVEGSSAVAPASAPSLIVAPSIRGSVRLSPGWHCYGQGVRHVPNVSPEAADLPVARVTSEEASSRSRSSSCTSMAVVERRPASGEEQQQTASEGSQQPSSLSGSDQQQQETLRADGGGDGWRILGLLGEAAGRQQSGSHDCAESGSAGLGRATRDFRSVPTSPSLSLQTGQRPSPLSPLGSGWVSPAAGDATARREQQAYVAPNRSSSGTLLGGGGLLPWLEDSVDEQQIPHASSLLRAAGGEQGNGRGVLVLQRQALLGVPQPPTACAVLLADDGLVNDLLQGLPGVDAGDALVVAMVEALRPNGATRFCPERAM